MLSVVTWWNGAFDRGNVPDEMSRVREPVSEIMKNCGIPLASVEEDEILVCWKNLASRYVDLKR